MFIELENTFSEERDAGFYPYILFGGRILYRSLQAVNCYHQCFFGKGKKKLPELLDTLIGNLNTNQ